MYSMAMNGMINTVFIKGDYVTEKPSLWNIPPTPSIKIVESIGATTFDTFLYFTDGTHADANDCILYAKFSDLLEKEMARIELEEKLSNMARKIGKEKCIDIASRIENTGYNGTK